MSLNNTFQLFPFNYRFRVPQFNRIRLEHSFVHKVILKLSTDANTKSRRQWWNVYVICIVASFVAVCECFSETVWICLCMYMYCISICMYPPQMELKFLAKEFLTNFRVFLTMKCIYISWTYHQLIKAYTLKWWSSQALSSAIPLTTGKRPWRRCRDGNSNIMCIIIFQYSFSKLYSDLPSISCTIRPYYNFWNISSYVCVRVSWGKE